MCSHSSQTPSTSSSGLGSSRKLMRCKHWLSLLFLFLLLNKSQRPLTQCLRTALTIHGGAHNAACIARTFAAGKKIFNLLVI